jgi:galactokinase
MDQFASVCGSEGQILCLDCRSLEWSSAVLPPGATLVIADTSVRRSLADSAYNERREACEEAVRLLQRTLTGIQSLRDVSPEAFEGSAAALPPLIAKRARHVVEEIARTGKAISVLERGDCPALGRLMNECHASLRDLYEVSCTELDTMVAIAQSLDGCFGARMTGAGFGGCTVNLAQTEMAAGFARALAYRYEKETGLQAQVFLTRPAPGAGVRLPP